ncbi:protein-glutamate O-methyltransferase CheR [Pseudoroseomonas cervicalis]|uniref:CheR family methyltransferase n=1 Tax=Teichococcus cervicalis TaxID=204525 RepID=UPI0022F19036|nr:CheR family methyltransferase [Pseudoroseomonas cervicalis]WBV45368.1 protein-glutamate methyltransferase [Pseudoroseomonas cervicalis]
MVRPAGMNAAPQFLPDVEFARLKAEVIARTGHFYYEDKDALLWERLRRRLRETGLPGPAAYLERLRDPAQGEAEWAALEAEITIGETFFFRYAEQFAALQQTILPDILARRRGERRLRAWSAGCASGAEPYSLGILLRRMLGEAVPDWRLSLLGTDLNEAALAMARRGQYSRWALRSLPAEELERDFLPGADGRSWLLRPQHRAMVRFERQNLLGLLDGTAPLQMTGFDLILCRNVLIYFHPEMVERLVRALAERLAEGGWLLLGHAEPNPVFAEFLEVVNLPGTVAYRRGGAPLPAPPPAPPAQVAPILAPPEAGWRPPALPPSPRPPPPPPAALPPPPPGEAPAALLALARQYADAGDLARAREACAEGLRLAPTDPALHYYDGLVQRGLGRPEAAERAFRRALYLRGDFAMAHYQLGLLLLDEGSPLAGRRALAVAGRLAQSLPDAAALPEGDGMTARALREAARLHLETARSEERS